MMNEMNIKKMEADELSDDMLDNVSGGGVGLFLLGTVAAWAITKALDNAWSTPNCPVPPCNCCR